MRRASTLRSALAVGIAVASAMLCEPASEGARRSSVIALPAKPPPYWAGSVTLSPTGRWLAVSAGNYLILVRDLRSNRWVRTFRGDAYPPVRWHPSRPVLLFGNGTYKKPAFDTGCLSTGKRHQLFRSDLDPLAWTKAGVLLENVIGAVDGTRVSSGATSGTRSPGTMGKGQPSGTCQAGRTTRWLPNRNPPSQTSPARHAGSRHIAECRGGGSGCAPAESSLG